MNVLKFENISLKICLQNVSWNFWAFCFSFLWLFAKNLFLTGIIAIFVLIIFSFTKITFFITYIFIAIFCGLFGNSIVDQYTNKIYDQANTDQLKNICKSYYQSNNYICAVCMFFVAQFSVLTLWNLYDIVSVLLTFATTLLTAAILYHIHQERQNYLFNPDKEYCYLEKIPKDYWMVFQNIENGKIFSINFGFIMFNLFWTVCVKMYKETLIFFTLLLLHSYITLNFNVYESVNFLILDSVFKTIDILLSIGGINLVYYHHVMTKCNLKCVISQKTVKKCFKASISIFLLVCCINFGNIISSDVDFLNIYLAHVEQNEGKFTTKKRAEIVECYNKLYHKGNISGRPKARNITDTESNFLQITKIKDSQGIYNTIVQVACLWSPSLIKGLCRIVIYITKKQSGDYFS